MPHLNKVILLSLSAVIAAAVVVLAFLPGCTDMVNGMCRIDDVLQPVVVAVADVAGTATGQPDINAGAAIDSKAIHPAVVAACAKLGGVAVSPPSPAAKP